MPSELHTGEQTVEENLLEETKVEKEDLKEKSKVPKSLIAYVLVILSALSLSLSFILNKLANRLNTIDQLIIRYSCQFLTALIICRYKKLNCFGKKNERKLLAIRGSFGVIISSSTLVAIRLVNPSDCITIINSTVILTAIVCRIFIKEKLTIIHIFSVLLTIFGVACIFRPSFLFPTKQQINESLNSTTYNDTFKLIDNKQSEMYTVIGILLALGASLTFAFSNLYMKILSNAKVHFSVVAIYPSLLSLPVMTLTSLILVFTKITYKNVELDNKLWTHILFSSIGGLCGASGILLLSLSFNYEDASKISIVKTIDVFFSFLFQFLFLNIKVDLLGIIGAISIISGTILVILFKIIEQNTKTNNNLFKILIFKF
jgi:drug/metabolite transporter (DMT)-like permease